jgi:5-hydroxyisourate hydrolase-like protein (transthyretin family)
VTAAVGVRHSLAKAAARYGCRLLIFVTCVVLPSTLRTQEPPNSAPRTLTGHVMHAVKSGLAPVRGVMVTLHRVGADHAGPIDSTRTASDGRYTFSYRPSGNADAVYLASVGYQGITYFSTPAAASQGVPDGEITVFDTTSRAVRIRTAGHHVIVSAPRADGRREVEEVFELSNDSSVTRIARGDSVPVWSAVAPNEAGDVQGAPTADIAPGAITVRGKRVELYAPISPGMRQLAYGYTVAPDGFPLTLPLGAPTEVLEVLVEEPSARAEGARLNEVAPVSKAGHTFRRFLAQDVPASSELRIVVPPPVPHERTKITRRIAIALGVLLALAFAWTLRRRADGTVAIDGRAPAHDSPAAQALLHEIAALDAAHARHGAAAPNAEAEYERTRSALKDRLKAALASGDGPQ